MRIGAQPHSGRAGNTPGHSPHYALTAQTHRKAFYEEGRPQGGLLSSTENVSGRDGRGRAHREPLHQQPGLRSPEHIRRREPERQPARESLAEAPPDRHTAAAQTGPSHEQRARAAGRGECRPLGHDGPAVPPARRPRGPQRRAQPRDGPCATSSYRASQCPAGHREHPAPKHPRPPRLPHQAAREPSRLRDGGSHSPHGEQPARPEPDGRRKRPRARGLRCEPDGEPPAEPRARRRQPWGPQPAQLAREPPREQRRHPC